jgi:hypothetical protein
VLAALGEAVWSGHLVGFVESTIDGTVVCALEDDTVCALDDPLLLFVFLLLQVDIIDMLGTIEIRAVAKDII